MIFWPVYEGVFDPLRNYCHRTPPKRTFFRGGNCVFAFCIIIPLSFLAKKTASCSFAQVEDIFPSNFQIYPTTCFIRIELIFTKTEIVPIAFSYFDQILNKYDIFSLFLKKTLTFRFYSTTSCFL